MVMKILFGVGLFGCNQGVHREVWFVNMIIDMGTLIDTFITHPAAPVFAGHTSIR